jgi:hypothetical protein
MKRILTAGVIFAVFLPVLLTGCSQEASPSATVSSPSETKPPESLSSISNPTSNGAESRPSPLPQKTLSPQEIAFNSLTAAEKMSTLKFDMDFNLKFDLGDGDQSHNMAMQETAIGTVNIPGKEMSLVADLIMNIPNQAAQNMSADMYSTGGWIYMNGNMPGSEAGWIKMKLTDELWMQQSRMTSLTEFLKSPINVEQLGSENIKGIDCYVLSITPDMKSIYDWMAGQTFAGQSGMDPARLNMSPPSGEFKIKEWVSKTGYLVTKQQIAIKFDISSGAPATSTGPSSQIAMDMNAIMNYYDHGKPVVIQLPPEALNAREMSLGTQSSHSEPTMTIQN